MGVPVFRAENGSLPVPSAKAGVHLRFRFSF